MRISDTSFDAIIVGAGPAGASTAYHLAKTGRRVLLLEKQAFPRDKACGDGLTRKTVEALFEMGLENELESYPKVSGIKVLTEARGSREYRYERLERAGGRYGLVVPRQELDHIICRKAVEAGAILWENAAVEGPLFHRGRVCGVRARRDATDLDIHAPFVVAADGGNSHFARAVGLLNNDRWSVGYALRGYFDRVVDASDLFMVYVPLTDPDSHRMLAGYGWVFPIGVSSVNIGVGFYPSQSQDFDANLRRIFEHFVEGLRRKDPRFEAMELKGKIRGAPLRSGLDPAQCEGKGVLLVGDAAGLVDPFTGEGIRTGLLSGKLAAGVLADALAAPDPVEADLSNYSSLLEKHFRDTFRMGRKFVRTYGFMWKLLESTIDVQYPFFVSFHRAVMDYGVDDDPYTGLASTLPLDAPWLWQTDLVADLKSVRKRLSETIQADFQLLAKLSLKLLDPTGSFLRSALLLLSGHFGNPKYPERIDIAAASELMNLAFMIHNDVLDEPSTGTQLDKGASARPVNWANMFAIMAGDYLMVKSYELAARAGHEVSQVISQASSAVCAGQIKAFELAHVAHQDEQSYISMVEKKTGGFYELACRLGAQVSGADTQTIHALSSFGRLLGVAVQLTNDTLEILAEHDHAGKHPIARAVEEGLYTLPMLYSAGLDSNGIRGMLGNKVYTSGEIDRILDILRSNGSLLRTLRRAQDFATSALESLEPLPDSPATCALVDIAHFVVDRVAHQVSGVQSLRKAMPDFEAELALFEAMRPRG